MTIFRTPDAQATLTRWHERFRERIGRPTQSRVVKSRFGDTHVLTCGAESAPPIVLFHGAMASSAHAMLEVASLADRFRLIAPDVIGQSPMSAQVRPEVNGSAYGEWAADCLDALQLPSARVLGVSWGGMVALRLAALAPERIEKLSLVVPAALTQGSGIEAMRQLLLPMALYRAFPSPARLERFLRPLLTTFDPDWTEYMGDAFRLYKLDFRPPRLLRNGEMEGLKAPVQVFGAERDLSFPGRALLARAKEIFPNLTCSELLLGAKHAPSFEPDARRDLAAKIAAFME